MKGSRIFLLILLWSGPLCAQDVIVRDDTDELVFMPYDLTYLIDSTNTLTIADISSQKFAGSFKSHSAYQNRDFRTNTSYWIRMSVRVDESSRKVWLLEFYDQTIDIIEAYIPTSEGHQVVRLGDAMAFSDRPFRHKNFEIPIARSHENGVYYFRIQSHEFADLRIALRSVNRFIFYALNEYFLFGTFYGMIIIISLYNFLIFLAIREIKNIYYII